MEKNYTATSSKIKAGIRIALIMARSYISRRLCRDVNYLPCSICDAPIIQTADIFSHREEISCIGCGSTPRFRALMSAFMHSRLGLNNEPTLISTPRNRSLVGLGMSDAGLYASILQFKFCYTNTFYHQKPFFDVSNPGKSHFEKCDFVISSDVFEHVASPPLEIFAAVRKVLKTGGVLIFTVPYGDNMETIEHYPDLHDYRIEGSGVDRVLVNTTLSGMEQKFSNLVFHGGDGDTLELRIFSLRNILFLLETAGFHSIVVHKDGLNYPRPSDWKSYGCPITAIAK